MYLQIEEHVWRNLVGAIATGCEPYLVIRFQQHTDVRDMLRLYVVPPVQRRKAMLEHTPYVRMQL